MADREKVMKGLQCLSSPYAQDMTGRDCENCKYDNASCFLDITADALALLKEQEPVQFKVTRQDKSYPFWDTVCTGCGYETSTVKDFWKYCPVCGKPVKWK